MIWVCFEHLLLLVTGLAALHIEPGNIVLKNGSRLKLDCNGRPGARFTWYSPWRQQIARNKHVYDGRYEVKYHRNQGKSTLILDKTDISIGGTFKCKTEESGQRPEEKSVDVVILDSAELECPEHRHTFAEGQTLNLTCEVGFQGNLPPVLEWSATAVKNLVVRNETIITESKRSIYRLLTKASRALHGSTLSCTGKFEPQYQLSSDHESNTPTYNFKPCQIPRLDIQWPPTEDRIFLPQTVIYVEGQVIRCTVDSNPQPYIIYWRDSKEHKVSDTQYLVVQGPPGDYQYFCVAENVVDGHVNKAEKSLLITVGKRSNKAVQSSVSLPIIPGFLAIVTLFFQMMM